MAYINFICPHKKWKFYISVFFVLSGLMSFAQTTVTLNSVADCYIDQNGSTTNYGSVANMQVTSWGPSYNRRMLIKFDLSSIPASATINSAVLKLQETGTYGQTRTINLHRLTSSWVESTVTWSNMASNYNSTVAASSNVSWTGVFKIDSWTLTSEVQSLVSSGTNNGWLLKDNSENGYGEYWQFGAKENTNSSYRPVLEITYSAPLTITVSPSTPSICLGSSVSLTASGGTNYTWSPSSGLNTSTGAIVIASPATTTTYTVTGTSGSNSGTTTVTVSVNSNPSVSIGNQTICQGQTATFDAGAGFSSYLWNTGATTRTITTGTAGTYTATVTNSNGCQGSGSATLTVNSNPTVSMANQTICQGQTATFDAGAGFSSYSWNTGATTRTITTGTAGTYTATVTNGNGCQGSGSATLTVNTLPSISVAPTSLSILTGQSVTLTASGNSVSYGWSPSSGLNTTSGSVVIATPSSSTTYTVTGTGSNGCTATATSAITLTSNIYVQGNYATLVRQLDNNVFKVRGNDLLFVYDEQYELNGNDTLNYVIYDSSHNVVATKAQYPIIVKRGLNKNKLTHISNKLNGSGIYILEVINSKNEKFYLRFSI